MKLRFLCSIGKPQNRFIKLETELSIFLTFLFYKIVNKKSSYSLREQTIIPLSLSALKTETFST